jgi:hypothetical protein
VAAVALVETRLPQLAGETLQLTSWLAADGWTAALKVWVVPVPTVTVAGSTVTVIACEASLVFVPSPWQATSPVASTRRAGRWLRSEVIGGPLCDFVHALGGSGIAPQPRDT